MLIKSYPDYKKSDVQGICLTLEGDENQRHIGFLFLNTDEEVKLLHLASHLYLVYSIAEENDKKLWVDVPLNQPNVNHFKLFLESIFEQNGQDIPYGIGTDGLQFSEDGSLVAEPYAGFTCATFVMEVFHSQGYILIDTSEWPQRLEDQVWQEKILNILRRYYTDECFSYQKLLVGALRFKPEEVMAAGGSQNRPMNFESIQEPANELLEKLYELSVK
jgi:hypothetical protein